MQVLTTVERLVLESISTGTKDITALMRDTQLELRFLANILHALTLRSYITVTSEGYSVNRHLPLGEMQKLNDQKLQRYEALELIEGLSTGRTQNLGLRKAWVSEKDRTILKALIKNLEQFMQTLPPPPKDASLHDYTVVVWGEDKYGDVVKRLIGGVA
jgi:hypothetical protein